MLILVSTCFLLLNAPAHISNIVSKYYSIRALEHTTNSNASYKMSSESIQKMNEATAFWDDFRYGLLVFNQHLSYASYSINFFVYSFCGMKFRRELVRCMSKTYRPITLSRSMTTQNTA